MSTISKSKKSTAIAVLFFLMLASGVAWRWSGFADSSSSNPASSWQSEDELQILRGRTMGTTFQVSVRASFEAQDLSDLSQSIESLLEAVNASMSTYRPESEISRFNTLPPGSSLVVSDDFADVLNLSLEIARDSKGAFDPTVAPLVNAWGFGPKHPGRPDEKMSEKELADLHASIGYQKIIWDRSTQTLERANDIELDFSAVAKGYGVRRVAELLRSRKISNFMVEIGGEVAVGGTPTDERPWRIGIERPTKSAADLPEVQLIVPLHDTGMATSGDYRNYVERDGRRYSHTIDPRTGRPIDHALASVTVLHPDAARADALATAINVLGPEEGYHFAKSHQLAVLFITRADDGFRERMTSEFAEIVDVAVDHDGYVASEPDSAGGNSE